jgi:peptidoglycan/xylan/chitin deacetylase (PgdA/CDA1 family)
MLFANRIRGGKMKKVNVILLTVLFLTAINAGYAGTVAAPYQVGTWSGFRSAAITYTFDDDLPHQLSIAVPMFNGYGFKMTMYTITSPTWVWPANWPGLQAAAAQGHEIGNHTVTHVSLGPLDDANQIYQMSVSKAAIDANIPGNQCLTIAYPNCSMGKQSLIDDYFIAGRTCASTTPNPATPSNFYTIQCTILGSSGTNTLAGITGIDDAAAASGGWAVFLIHGIDTEPGAFSPLSSTILDQSLQYLDARRSTFWVNTFLNVVRYIKERNDVSVSETSNTGDTITLSVTDTLSDTIYNYPITIRRPLPAGWTSANVKQNGQQVSSSIVTVGSTQYVMFDVVPDGGDVVLYKSPAAAPTGLAATAGAGVISLNWNDNSEGDIAGYNIYRSTTTGSGYSKLNSSLLTASNYNDSNFSPGTAYYYVVTAVDIGTNESGYSSEASAALGFGSALREWWTGIEGNDISSLTSDVNYPDNPVGRALVVTLEGPVNWQDDYGTRIRGFLYPPENGDYTFWIASDANSELWLSTDADSANAVRIAHVSGYTGSQEWNKYPEQQSSAISLVGGQRYYIEVLHKAGIGEDNIAVAWQGPNITQQVIDGLYLSPCCLKFGDFAGLGSQWGQSGCNAGNDWCSGFDFNRNGSVDLSDLKAFTVEWLNGL